MTLRPAATSEPAAWHLADKADWFDRVRFGPPGFEAYVRIAFEDPETEPVETDPADVPDRIKETLTLLGAHTMTPSTVYAAIWEGWCGAGELPAAPRVLLPHREMLLFVGSIAQMRHAPAEAWGLDDGWRGQAPHLVWPSDHAWCLACEVDEEIEFTIAGSAEIVTALAEAIPGAVRRVQYGEECQLYRE